MLANVTLRAKVLIGVALACAGYIVFMPDNSQTIEPTRATGAAAHGDRSEAHGEAGAAVTSGTTHVIKPGATAVARKAVADAAFRLGDRVVAGPSVASLFSPHSWFVAPPPPPAAPPVAPPPPPVPTAPPLPFAYMGSYQTEGGSTYFLTAGDRVYDVKIGDTLDNTYTVDGVKSGQMLLTYMPLKIQQTLAVGEE